MSIRYSKSAVWRLLVALCIGVVLFVGVVLYGRLAQRSQDLFRRYVSDPVPNSVVDIRVDQTRSVFGYAYMFRFKISVKDWDLLLESRPFTKIRAVRFANGVLSWEGRGGGIMVVPIYASQRPPVWFTLEQWSDVKAYAIVKEGQEGEMDMWVLLYNEAIGEVYYFVSHGV